MAQTPSDSADVSEALRDFADPDSGQSIVEGGQLRDVEVQGENVELAIVLSTHSAVIAEDVAGDVADRLRARFPGLKSIVVEPRLEPRSVEKIGQIGLAGQERRGGRLGQRGRRQEHDRGLAGPGSGASRQPASV